MKQIGQRVNKTTLPSSASTRKSFLFLVPHAQRNFNLPRQHLQIVIGNWHVITVGQVEALGRLNLDSPLLNERDSYIFIFPNERPCLM